jgi:hypothetical protein
MASRLREKFGIDEARVKLREAKQHGRDCPYIYAAYIVLYEASEPMNCGQIVRRIFEKGYRKQGGKTPRHTLLAEIYKYRGDLLNEAPIIKIEERDPADSFNPHLVKFTINEMRSMH